MVQGCYIFFPIFFQVMNFSEISLVYVWLSHALWNRALKVRDLAKNLEKKYNNHEPSLHLHTNLQSAPADTGRNTFLYVNFLYINYPLRSSRLLIGFMNSSSCDNLLKR